MTENPYDTILLPTALDPILRMPPARSRAHVFRFHHYVLRRITRAVADPRIAGPPVAAARNPMRNAEHRRAVAIHPPLSGHRPRRCVTRHSPGAGVVKAAANRMSRPIRTCVLRIPLRCRDVSPTRAATIAAAQREPFAAVAAPQGFAGQAARRAIVNTIHD